MKESAIIDDSLRWAKVTGTRGRFVEFDFTIGDPDLTIELIMPYEAFAEFCRDNNVAVLPIGDGVAEAFEKLKWRSGVAGVSHSSRQPS